MTKSSSDIVVAIDQGTSSTKVIVVDATGEVIARSTMPLRQSHPKPGWVEQDAEELLESVVAAVDAAIDGIAHRVVSIGISSQRESALAWDAVTGRAIGPMLGWQDRRTVDAAQQLHANGHNAAVRASTGLPVDPMFSALKFAWLLDQFDPDRSRSAAGEIMLGTVDAWLVYRLTGEHRVEVGNASRTQLLSLATGEWDPAMLELFRIPAAALPRVASSSEPTAAVTAINGLPADTRITGILGDSHAALYGHGVREPGAVKATYGTGSSIMGLLPSGHTPVDGLVRTIAWSTGTPVLAFEGNILSAGSTLVWLAGVLGMTPTAVSELAETVDDTGGVYLVPAFAGLGAPWWDDDAQAILTGFGLGTTSAQLARAAMESIALQVEDVLRCADEAVGVPISTILADGGPSSNHWLMQLQADVSQRVVRPSAVAELSALGVAHFAGESGRVWSADEVLAFHHGASALQPVEAADAAGERHRNWLDAVARARSTAIVPSTTQGSKP